MGKEHRKTVLFGLHKKSVDLFLKKLHHLQQLELQELKLKLKQAQEKDELLRNELKQLSDRDTEPVKPSLKVISFPQAAKDQTVVRFPIRPSVGALEEGSRHEALDAVQAAEAEEAPESEPVEAAEVEEAPESEPAKAAEPEELQESEPVEATEPAYRSDAPDTVNHHRGERKADSFWGDMEEYLDEDIVLTGPVTTVPTQEPRSFNRSERVEYPGKDFIQEAAATLQEEESESVAETEPNLEAADSISPPLESTPEIERIKRNYIVGKLAGENLIDSRGRIIIAKDDVITDNTINRAQQEGKLAELIVNMVLPRLDG